MIFITAKFRVKPEHADAWPQVSAAFTQATRSEPGCLWFEWSRSCDNPNEYVLIEAYKDAQAGKEHVESGHFAEAMKTQGKYAATRPKVISFEKPGTGWDELGEIEMP